MNVANLRPTYDHMNQMLTTMEADSDTGWMIESLAETAIRQVAQTHDLLLEEVGDIYNGLAGNFDDLIDYDKNILILTMTVLIGLMYNLSDD